MFGLSAFSAQQKTKEVGIRKVLGANVMSILKLLSKEYVTLILIANVLAIPTAWYLSREWLANFANRIELTPWILISSLFMALFIALLTVSYQGLKTAFLNPIDTLKEE